MHVFVWICVYLWVYVYIHECVNEYICMNACTHIWVYMWMYVCKCKSMNTYVYMWKHAWAHLYVHEWICMYAWVRICVWIHICVRYCMCVHGGRAKLSRSGRKESGEMTWRVVLVFSKRLRFRRPGDRVSVSVPLCFKKEDGKSPGMFWVAVLPEHLVF